MSYDLEPEKRQSPSPNKRPHPLEAPPTPLPPANDPQQPQRPRVMIHIPAVQPRIIWGLITINIAIFIAAFYVMDAKELNRFYNWGANSRDAVRNSGEYYRLISSMFLHGNEAHIFFNMYALYLIGQTVERFFGYTRFLIIYFLGGLTGSILSVLFNDAGASVGASGAVFAIFGAEMIFLYRHKKLLGKVAESQLRQLILIAVMNFAVGLLTTMNSTGVQIDNWGHLGGLAGGLALAWIIGPVFIPKLHPDQSGALIAADENPLQRSILPVLIYAVGLLILVTTGMTNG
jgi:rhomboid protease GluP